MMQLIKWREGKRAALSALFSFEVISSVEYVKYESKYDYSGIRSKSNDISTTSFSYFG
jgi:hypothetical protein